MPKLAGLDRAPGSELELFHMLPANGTKTLGSIAMCVRDHINSATMTAWFMSDYSFLRPDESVDRFMIQGGILTLQRNEAVQRMQGDWIMFIDDDMVWEPDAIRRLIEVRNELDLDVVGGLCFRRQEPFQPTLYMRESPTDGAYNFLEKWDTDVVEVDATGLAFVVIHKRVFERIAGYEMPPVAERRSLPGFFRWSGIFGEDLQFCQDAKATGSSIFVDTRIETRHVAEIQISKRHFLQEVATRGRDLEELRRTVNDRMGLPTMSADEAREALGWE